MKFRGLFIAFNILIVFMIAGCDLLPESSSLIRAPQYSQVVNDNEEDIKLVAKRFLPEGAKFLYPMSQKGADAVQLADIDDDGFKEMLVTFQGTSEGCSLGAIVLKRNNGEWKEIWQGEEQVNVVSLEFAQFIDITNDKICELLLGWSLGYGIGSNLEIISFKDNPKQISSLRYNRIEIFDVSPNENGRTPEIILTRKEDSQKEEDIPPLVLRWVEDGLVPAEDAYNEYYKDRIKTLKESSSPYDRNFLKWYYLSLMQVRSKRSDEAIDSLGRALNTISADYEKFRIKLEIYKAEALIQKEQYLEASDLLKSIIDRNESGQIKCTQDELAAAKLNFGRACVGLRDYENAELNYIEAYKIIKDVYGEGTPLLILNSYTVKKELKQLENLRNYYTNK